MKTFGIDCELNYESVGDTTYVFNLAARGDQRQKLRSESVMLLPQLPYEEFSDFYGNRFFRVVAAGGPFTIRYTAQVEVTRALPPSDNRPVYPARLPPDTLPYLLPSRYCESDRAFKLALDLFAGHASQLDCVEAICSWVRDNIRYEIGTSQPHGTGWDVLNSKTGVCRDFAHVAITLCRAMNIPARFITAHAHWELPPPDFHAVIECFVDGQWRMFDPTAMALVDDIICIGKGMDAAQVPFATIYGTYQMLSMSPLVQLIGAENTEQA